MIFGPADSFHLLAWATVKRPGLHVEVLSFQNPRPDQDYKDVKVNVLKGMTGTKLDYLICTKRVQKLIDVYKPDIIHTHYASSYGLICAKIKTNACKILTAWGSDINLARSNPLHRYLIDRSLLRYDWINVPSEDLKNKLISIGISPSRILVFQYGTDLDFCDSLRQEKNKKGDETIILSSRLWGTLYNIDKIVAAFKVAYLSNKNLKLILIGSGNADDNARIHNLIIDHPAIVSLGFIPKDELIKWLWTADIYISIPSSDGMSLSVLEALYCECYPIFSDIPPNCELLNFCEGTIAKSLDSHELASVILSVAKRCGEVNLSRNVEFVDARANFKKNMELIGKIYLAGKKS